MTRQRLVFFGNERLATGTTTTTPVLRGLVAAGYEIAAVVVNHSQARSRRTRELEIETAAAELGLSLLRPERPADIIAELTALEAPAAVLVAYGQIVPQAVIDIFPRGIINLHPSLLPRHRGPVPLEAVLLAGEPTTGASVMQLARRMDAGPVLAQAQLAAPEQVSKQALAELLLAAGRDLIIDKLPGILDGSAQPQPQDDAAATYDQLIAKADGLIDWSLPATVLERQIRAYLGWPGSRTTLCHTDVIITAAHVGGNGHTASLPYRPGQVFTDSHGELTVQTGAGLLMIDRLKPAGGRDMDARAFIAGHPLG